MYNDEYAATAAGAAAKVGLLKKNPLGYFLLSALAGAYIGFGILLSFTVSGTLGAIPMTKIAMGPVLRHRPEPGHHRRGGTVHG